MLELHVPNVTRSTLASPHLGYVSQKKLFFSCSIMSNSFQPHGLQHARLHYLPEFTQIHVHWVGDAIQPSHPLSNLLLLPSIFSHIRVLFNVWLFTSGGQSIGASSSASILPMNVQDWFPLGWTGLISLQFKGLSRVFSSTTVWKHQFFGIQHSLRSNSHIYTWLLGKP